MPLFEQPLDRLTPTQWDALIALGLASDMCLHRFKRTMGLPRVQRVLGMLRSVSPTSLLDIGSGRGVFLWPLLDAFPTLPVTALDRLSYRVEDLLAVCAGGITNLQAFEGDVTDLQFDDRSYDVITMLETLEHIPTPRAAVAEICRVASRYVILSVPSKPDSNPEHLHLFDQPTLTSLLQQAGAARVSIDYVPGHMLAFARMEHP